MQPYPPGQEHAEPDDRATDRRTTGIDKYGDWREAYNDPWGGTWQPLGYGYDPDDDPNAPVTRLTLLTSIELRVSDAYSKSGDGPSYTTVGVEHAVSLGPCPAMHDRLGRALAEPCGGKVIVGEGLRGPLIACTRADCGYQKPLLAMPKAVTRPAGVVEIARLDLPQRRPRVIEPSHHLTTPLFASMGFERASEGAAEGSERWRWPEELEAGAAETTDTGGLDFDLQLERLDWMDWAEDYREPVPEELQELIPLDADVGGLDDLTLADIDVELLKKRMAPRSRSRARELIQRRDGADALVPPSRARKLERGERRRAPIEERGVNMSPVNQSHANVSQRAVIMSPRYLATTPYRVVQRWPWGASCSLLDAGSVILTSKGVPVPMRPPWCHPSELRALVESWGRAAAGELRGVRAPKMLSLWEGDQRVRIFPPDNDERWLDAQTAVVVYPYGYAGRTDARTTRPQTKALRSGQLERIRVQWDFERRRIWTRTLTREGPAPRMAGLFRRTLRNTYRTPTKKQIERMAAILNEAAALADRAVTVRTTTPIKKEGPMTSKQAQKKQRERHYMSVFMSEALHARINAAAALATVARGKKVGASEWVVEVIEAALKKEGTP